MISIGLQERIGGATLGNLLSIAAKPAKSKRTSSPGGGGGVEELAGGGVVRFVVVENKGQY